MTKLPLLTVSSLTLALCSFGLIAGLIQRWTHRYKLLQVIGLGIKIIGMGLLVSGGKGTTSVVNFVFIQRESLAWSACRLLTPQSLSAPVGPSLW